MKIDLITPGPNTTGESSAHGFGNFSLKLANNGANTNMTEVLNIKSGGNATFAGNITTSSLGGDGSPILDITGTASATYNWISKSMHANLTSGETSIHLFGQHASTKNSGYIGYTHSGTSGSDDNKITLGMYSANHLLTISPTVATFAVDTVAPGVYVGAVNTSFDLYNNGTSYFNGEVIVDSDLTISGAGNNGNARLMLQNSTTQSGRTSTAAAGYGVLKQRDINNEVVANQNTHTAAFGWYTIAIPSGYSNAGLGADIELIIRNGGRHHNGKSLRKFIINNI